MKTKTQPIAFSKLREVIGEDAEIIFISEHGNSVCVVYPDKSEGNLHWSPYCQDWHFSDTNSSYQAGYAYACGYHD